jgi:hypothetical protein
MHFDIKPQWLRSSSGTVMLVQDMAADERTLRQALAGLEAALKGDLQTLATFREVREPGALHVADGPALDPVCHCRCVLLLHDQLSGLQPRFAIRPCVPAESGGSAA